MHANPKAFFDWVNERRGMYGAEPPYGWHSRYKGYAWEGEGHENLTFSIRWTWDDGLACAAQAEADRLAKGGAFVGYRTKNQGTYGYAVKRVFYVDGINTDKWRISSDELPDDYNGEVCGAAAGCFPLGQNNGSARMALFYHDFGGDGPAIHRLGVGAAMGADCRVFWVLQFGT